MEIDHNDEDNEGVTQINGAGPQMMGNTQNGLIRGSITKTIS